MRSKLLALHLINTIIVTYRHIFRTPAHILYTTYANDQLYIHAIKQYLCLTISRNVASVVPQVYEIAMEIFGEVLIHLRVFLKVRYLVRQRSDCLARIGCDLH